MSNKTKCACQKMSNDQKKYIDLLRTKNSIDISLKMRNELLKKAREKFWDTNQESGSKCSLIKYVWSKSCENSDGTNRSKKAVRFDPVISKFVCHLKYKLGVGNYNCTVSVFTLPSSIQLSRHDILDSNAQDRIIFQTLEQTKHEFDNRPERSNRNTNLNYRKWKRMDIVKFDEIKPRGKMYYNPYTRDTVRFDNATHDTDTLMKEMNTLDSNIKKSEVEDKINDNENKIEKERIIPNITQHVLLFMF